MNKEDIWIITYMMILWKTQDSKKAKQKANQAVRDFVASP